MVVRNYGAGSSQTSGFSVSYGETVLTDQHKISLSPAQPLTFSVNVEEYEVKVVPNVDAPSFSFLVDDENVKLKSIKDYSSAFKIKKGFIKGSIFIKSRRLLNAFGTQFIQRCCGVAVEEPHAFRHFVR